MPLSLEQKFSAHIHHIKDNEFIIIELARGNYHTALKRFSPSFLQGAYFLLIDTDLETCRRRIKERVAHPHTSDDHSVSDYALDHFYVRQYAPRDSTIKKTFRKLRNRGSWSSFTPKLDALLDEIVSSMQIQIMP